MRVPCREAPRGEKRPADKIGAAVMVAKIATDELTDPVSKRRMLRIAEDYEELGRRAERRLQQRSKNSN